MKKIIGILLVILMLVTSFTTFAFQEENENDKFLKLMMESGSFGSSYDITIIEDDVYPGFLDCDLSILTASAESNQDGWTINVTAKNNAYCMATSCWGWYSPTGRSCWGEWDFYQESEKTVNISLRLADDEPEPGATYRIELVVDELFLGDITIPATNSWYLATIHNVTLTQGVHTLFAGTYQMDYYPDIYLDYILVGDQRIEGEEYDRMGGNDPEPDGKGLLVSPYNVAIEFWEGNPYDSGILIGETDIGKEQEIIDMNHIYPEYTYTTHYIENNATYSANYEWVPLIQKDSYDIYVLLKADFMGGLIYDTNNSNNLKHFIILGNIKPVANFTSSPDNPLNSSIIHFTDTSADSDGSIVSWWWNFDDGYYSDLQHPVHCYYNNGIYTVNLTVTDNKGGTGTYSVVIVVNTAVEAIENLNDDILDMELPSNIKNDLLSKLNNAINFLNNNKPNQAISQLLEFINIVEAQRGKKITEDQAVYLITVAQWIIDDIGGIYTVKNEVVNPPFLKFLENHPFLYYVVRLVLKL